MGDTQTTWSIVGSGMRAQWRRLNVSSRNLANAENTRDVDGEPYKKRNVLFSTVMDDMSGVRVDGTKVSDEPYREVFNPAHPSANDEGMVTMPNVDVPTETVSMMSASRAYKANFMAMQSFRKICQKTLELIG